MSREREKELAAWTAVDWVKDGMTIGLGSGSTMNVFIEKLGERVQQGLSVEAVSSSVKSARLAEQHGIRVRAMEEATAVELAVDGADEVTTKGLLVKGGGGSLLREKLVLEAAEKRLILIDAGKYVQAAGAFPLPVEIVPFAYRQTMERIRRTGLEPELRVRKDEPFVTDNGLWIVDCQTKGVTVNESLHEQLKQLTGVVETGIFAAMADDVLIGKTDKVEHLTFSR
ncbi:ribose-5-phosphate isomerase RpiA [Alkalicoccus luteus]|uniref:Ribose-5-phosphate isomerase A n=1 Tax=Alkalicoccus luteus TaxID=1237094 RepID=A0A969PMD3_9BACI|nr:ribose-5-phosphate isomerase RpiA [Alkalicoccus luteus]NJP36075.1 ribose-5-phosphate isomerase RpiA [Alkalicoccus luteus]